MLYEILKYILSRYSLRDYLLFSYALTVINVQLFLETGEHFFREVH